MTEKCNNCNSFCEEVHPNLKNQSLCCKCRDDKHVCEICLTKFFNYNQMKDVQIFYAKYSQIYKIKLYIKIYLNNILYILIYIKIFLKGILNRILKIIFLTKLTKKSEKI